MMQHTFHRIAWLIAIWMLCSVTSVNATPRVEQPAAWRTTPVLSSDIQPSYQFHSTSVYTPIVGTTSYTSGTVYTPGSSGPARSRKGGWGDPDDDEDMPIGTVPAVPVGEPLILLALAALYFVWRRRKDSV